MPVYQSVSQSFGKQKTSWKICFLMHNLSSFVELLKRESLARDQTGGIASKETRTVSKRGGRLLHQSTARCNRETVGLKPAQTCVRECRRTMSLLFSGLPPQGPSCGHGPTWRRSSRTPTSSPPAMERRRCWGYNSSPTWPTFEKTTAGLN